jgi:hypothetical protein
MKILRDGDVVAGWTAAQWVTVLRGGVPALTSHAAAMAFRLNYLLTHDTPAAYAGKDLEIELIEVSLILESVLRTKPTTERGTYEVATLLRSARHD